MQSYELTDVQAEGSATVAALRAELQARGITEYAVVDHGHDMAQAGVSAHPAWTIVFGNPAAGEALLARELTAAVDIPLRLAVIGAEAGRSRIVLRPMESLLDPALADLAQRLSAVLRELAAATRERAQRA